MRTKRRKDNKNNWANRCCTLVVARLSSSYVKVMVLLPQARTPAFSRLHHALLRFVASVGGSWNASAATKELMAVVTEKQGQQRPQRNVQHLLGEDGPQSELQVTNFFLAVKKMAKFSLTIFKPI